MDRLTFVFNEQKIQDDGLSKDAILQFARDYSKKNDIAESSYGVFEKDGEDAMCMLTFIAVNILDEETGYIDYISKLELEVNGKKEDCVESQKRWLARHSKIGMRS